MPKFLITQRGTYIHTHLRFQAIHDVNWHHFGRIKSLAAHPVTLAMYANFVSLGLKLIQRFPPCNQEGSW